MGELRFRASVPPRGRSRSVNQGQIGRICPQALPAWSLINTEGVPAYLTGKPFNVSEAEAALASAPVTPPPLDPRTSEDCLFLDVVVPQDIFHKANRTGKSTSPTVVWVHGGGFTTGEKTGSGLYNPAGLFNASQAAGSEGFVFVAINYRVRVTNGSFSKYFGTDKCILVGSSRMAGWPGSTSGRDCQRWSLRSTTCPSLGAAQHSLVRR